MFLKSLFIIFLQKLHNLHMFGHKVGPKRRFLQCCFKVFFKNNIISTFLSIELVRNSLFFQCPNIPDPLNTSLFAVFFIFVCFSVARKHQQNPGSVQNRFWGPPPELISNKCDFEQKHKHFLVWLFAHAFTAKAVWADFWKSVAKA